MAESDQKTDVAVGLSTPTILAIKSRMKKILNLADHARLPGRFYGALVSLATGA